MPTTKPGWRRPRLSIRALMIGIATLALAFASIWVYVPWLKWRVRVDRIIDKKLAAPDQNANIMFDPSYATYNKLTGPEYLDVLANPRYVAERLFETSANDADPKRRAKAFSALQRLLVEAGLPALAQEFLGRVLRQAVAGTPTPGDEQAAIEFVETLESYLGLDDAQRASILARARQLARGPDPGDTLPFWVSLIGQVGGPPEIEFLLELDDARDPKSFTFGVGSPLMHLRVPALLDHIKRWLDEPTRALGALDYTILPCTALGRQLLLDVVLTPGREDDVRRKAMRLLKRDCNGVELLLRACKDAERRRILGRFYGPDRQNATVYSRGLPAQLDGWFLPMNLAEVMNPDDPRPELLELHAESVYINYPWLTLIGGTSTSYWSHLRKRMLDQGKTDAEAERSVQAIVEGDVAVARELSGRNDLSTHEEWEQWSRETKIEAQLVTFGRWLELMVAHPDLMAIKEFERYFDSPRSVKPELVPALARLARTAPSGTRWRACLTLLLYCDRTEEAPLLIDELEHELRDHPYRFADRNTWPILILRYRFGVNYFWDVAAWRRWWADYQRQVMPRPIRASAAG